MSHSPSEQRPSKDRLPFSWTWDESARTWRMSMVDMGDGLLAGYDHFAGYYERRLIEEIHRLRTTLTGIQSCATCEVCRGAATRALGGGEPASSLDAKVGALLIGRGFYDRMKDQTDEDTAARIVYEFLQAARPIVSAHYGRTPPPGADER